MADSVTEVIGNDSNCAPKSLKRKYDRRASNGTTKDKRHLNPNFYRKPNWAKHLARNTAAGLFKTADIRQQCLSLLETKDDRLRFEVIRYLWDRLEGKPFTAANPADARPEGINDARLQVAINNLNVLAPELKRSAKPTPALPSHIETSPPKSSVNKG